MVEIAELAGLIKDEGTTAGLLALMLYFILTYLKSEKASKPAEPDWVKHVNEAVDKILAKLEAHDQRVIDRELRHEDRINRLFGMLQEIRARVNVRGSN